MGTIETILMMLLVLDAIALGVLVLLQQGKGADIGAAFGSGSANTVFGSAGSASFLAKLTTWLAIAFFLISFGLAYTAKEHAVALRNEGIPRVATPAAPQGSESTPAAAPALGDVPPPAEEPANQNQGAPPAQPDAQLTPKKEPVDSDVPNV